MTGRILSLWCCIVLLIYNPVIAQDTSIQYNLNNYSSKLSYSVNEKTQKLTNKLDKQTEKYLRKFAKEEARIKGKLSKIDSITSNSIFSLSAAEYTKFHSKIKSIQTKVGNTGQYIPWFDTIKTSLKFLEESRNKISKFTSHSSELKETLDKVKTLESKFQQTEQIKQYIKQRRALLKDQLGKYGLDKELKNFNKQAYYYTQQVNEYKQLFQDPNKIEAKAISLLNKIPAFQQFMKQYGALSGLFDIPQNYAQNVAGLQTRNQVQTLIQEKIRNIAPNGKEVVQQNIQSAQSQLTQLRKNLPALGNADGEMPDFNPNNQKSKSFRNRLELGSNLQTTKSNRVFPTTSDIGLSLGYKLNDKSVLGLGGSYKLGLGKDIRKISISHQGIGFRSFIDWKLKGSFWISGGAELNYRSEFKEFEVFKNYASWQKSALIGLSKKYQISNKFKGNIQVLFDFLHHYQIPKTQAVLFRVGYVFK